MGTVPNGGGHNRAARIKDICKAAKELGVTRQHLRLVIQGKRESKPLLRRYLSWKAKIAKKGQS